ncbi:MAG TPA: hypothetical protein VMI54_14130 [Polyangiaceae bacterium]|nr:hypothetical protein [Polyangiaceae bacterium]
MTAALGAFAPARTRAVLLAAFAAVSTAAGCGGGGAADDDSSGNHGGHAGNAVAAGGASAGTSSSGATGGSTVNSGGHGTGTGGTTGGSAAGGTAGAATGGSAPGGGAGQTTGGSGSQNGGAPGGAGASTSAGGAGRTGAGGGTAGSGMSAGGASGGGTAGNGAAGTGSGATGICKFASGLNIAWVNFANDVPNPDLATFKTIFTNTYAAGGRVVRWWFHTNGTTTPGYDSSGMAQKLQQSHIDGVKAILSAAHDAGVVVNISLWSFDMLQDNAGAAHTNNQALLENDANRQAYIDNYLTPLVNAIKGTPGLYSWEIFNEPEGMGPSGWATYRTTEAAIQKTVNWFAAAIHTADPSALVTNGSQTFDYCSNVSGKNQYYSDQALIQAGGKQNGTLDFYEVHYYMSNGTSNSCFTHPASYWNLDKKLVMGEFAAQGVDNIALNDLYTNLYTNGYDGAWAWSYDADYVWPAMQAPMQALFKAHADVGNCP